jgi:hypothetical protein
MSHQGSLMRNLGAFFGEVAKAVRTDVRAPANQPRTIELSSTEHNEPVQTPMGQGQARTKVREEVDIHPDHLTARRITIEEIQVPRTPSPTPNGQ